MNGNNSGPRAIERAAGFSNGAALLDDFLRQALRVGDPRNPYEMEQALRRYYPDAATRLDDEASGHSIGTTLAPTAPGPLARGGESPGERAYAESLAHLEDDLAALVAAPANRGWRPELSGWRGAQVREYTDGADAARLAQDPARRERAFFAVRRLGEYARLARLVGVMNLELNPAYRRLATTLDACATVLRVLMGEALYHAGLGDGGVMIQVPLADLRLRRDALINALRRFTGLAEESTDGDWGTDAAAYGELLEALDRASAPELKVYLRADALAQILDDMLASVARQDPDALRRLAATVPVEINRLERLQLVAEDRVTAARASAGSLSAGLSGFTQTLKLFVDAFKKARGGSRLVDLAVPLPLAAQRSASLDVEGRSVLRELVNLRGQLAREVECYLSCCGCGSDDLRCQVKLDKVLFDVDRAIDLYALGQGTRPEWGDEERRAWVYGHIAENFAKDATCVAEEDAYPILADAARAALDAIAFVGALAEDANVPPPAVGTTTLSVQDLQERLQNFLAAADLRAAGHALDEGVMRDFALLPALISTTGLQEPGIAVAIPVVVSIVQVAAGAVASPPTLTSGVSWPAGLPSVPATIAHVSFGGAPPLLAFTRNAFPSTGGPFSTAPALSGTMAPVLTLVSATVRSACDALIATVAFLSDQSAVSPADALKYVKATASITDSSIREIETRLVASVTASDPELTPVARIALTNARAVAAAAADVAKRAAALAAPAQTPVTLWEVLREVGATLTPSPLPSAISDPIQKHKLVTQVFEEQLRAEEAWGVLVGALAPRCLGPGRTELVSAGRELLHGSMPSYRAASPLPRSPVAAPPSLRVAADQVSAGARSAASGIASLVALQQVRAGGHAVQVQGTSSLGAAPGRSIGVRTPAGGAQPVYVVQYTRVHAEAAKYFLDAAESVLAAINSVDTGDNNFVSTFSTEFTNLNHWAVGSTFTADRFVEAFANLSAVSGNVVGELLRGFFAGLGSVPPGSQITERRRYVKSLRTISALYTPAP